MALTNAQRQAAYRVRHLKDTEGLGERLNMVVSVDAKNQLKRLASCYGVTQRQLIERLLADAQSQALNTLNGTQANAYYDCTLTLSVTA
jgi:hypothetical protein